jgi:hypothetical protein
MQGHRLEVKPAADPRSAQHDAAGAPRVADEERIDEFSAHGPLGTPVGALDGVVELRTTSSQVDRLARFDGTLEFSLALSDLSWRKASHVALNDAGRGRQAPAALL